jgi:hypothetical protein
MVSSILFLPGEGQLYAAYCFHFELSRIQQLAIVPIFFGLYILYKTTIFQQSTISLISVKIY